MLATPSAIWAAPSSNSEPEPSTDCAKNPGVTQKKMTHILRSLACSQAKNFKDCEEVAGLTAAQKTAIAAGGAAATAGGVYMAKTAAKYRSENIALCQFAGLGSPEEIFSKRNVAWMLLSGAELEAFAAGSKVTCQTQHADGLLRSSSSNAAKDANAQVTKQSGEIAKQSQNVKDLEAGVKNAAQASAEYDKALNEFYSTDSRMKDTNEALEKVRAEISAKTAEMGSMAKDSPKYRAYQQDMDRLIEKRTQLKTTLENLKRSMMPHADPALTQRIQAASKAKQNADAEVKKLETKLGGNLDTQKALLEKQQENLKQYKAAGAEYERVSRQHSTGLSRQRVQASLDAVKEVGAVSEEHAKNLAHIQYLLDAAERNELMAVQRAGVSAATRMATAKAAAMLGAKTVGRAGLKVLSGVAAAAGSTVVFAGELYMGPDADADKACLMTRPGSDLLLKLTSFAGDNNCKPRTSIKDTGEFRKILTTSGPEQMKYFNNPDFCQWLNDVYQVHAPKIKATCTSSGATYTTDAGQHVQVAWNASGGIERFDAFGDSGMSEDQMHSVFIKDGKVDSVGMVLSHKQSKMEQSFKSPAFDSKSQHIFKYPANEQQVGAMYKQKTESAYLGYHLATLSLAEIKSCCHPGDPAVESSTCSSRYGIRSNTGTAAPSGVGGTSGEGAR
jgi:hypothetical protein